jgi:hypothetical protein
MFILSEYFLWRIVVSPPHWARVSWNPFQFIISRGSYEGDVFSMETGIFVLPNLPFFMFVFSIAINLYYLSKKEL